MCYNLDELTGTVVEKLDDGRLAFYDGEFRWLVPCEEHDGYYFEDMSEDDAFRFVV